jgi:hypothetical protein
VLRRSLSTLFTFCILVEAFVEARQLRDLDPSCFQWLACFPAYLVRPDYSDIRL